MILAAGVAPAVVKSSSLMKLFVPPEKEIILDPLILSPEKALADAIDRDVYAYVNRLLTPSIITRESLEILESILKQQDPPQSFFDPLPYQFSKIGVGLKVRK